MTEPGEDNQEWELKELFTEVRYFVTGDVDEKVLAKMVNSVMNYKKMFSGSRPIETWGF